MGYIDHFVHAAEYSGYVVLSASEAGPSPMEQALSAARSKLTVLGQDANWQAIHQHVGALAHAGISVVGFAKAGIWAHEQGFHVLVLRSVSKVDLADEQAFVASFGRWLDKLKDLLPKFQLSDQARSTASALAQAAGLTDPVLAAGLTAVLTFAQGGGQVKSLAVLPVLSAAPTFREHWQTTDLVSEPWTGPWVIEWLWDLGTGEVVEGGHSSVERSDRTLFGGAKGLENALRVTTG